MKFKADMDFICPECGEMFTVPPDSAESFAVCSECRKKVAIAELETKADGSTTQRSPSDGSEEHPQLGEDFHILGQLGRGGMGTVYQARQRSLNRMVAVKVLPADFAVDEQFVQRFYRESETMATLDHTNIVQVISRGCEDNTYYFVMELVEGEGLDQLLKKGALSQEDKLDLLVQVCNALAYAHEQGVVHRDIKPANILIKHTGEVKISDFGLARITSGDAPVTTDLTASYIAMGTLKYMAPEQKTDSKRVDHRADIFSLGVMMYEMFTGKEPSGWFAPPSQANPEVDPRLDQILHRALQPDPDDRYDSAAEIGESLRDILDRPGEGTSQETQIMPGSAPTTPPVAESGTSGKKVALSLALGQNLGCTVALTVMSVLFVAGLLILPQIQNPPLYNTAKAPKNKVGDKKVQNDIPEERPRDGDFQGGVDEKRVDSGSGVALVDPTIDPKSAVKPNLDGSLPPSELPSPEGQGGAVDSLRRLGGFDKRRKGLLEWGTARQNRKQHLSLYQKTYQQVQRGQYGAAEKSYTQLIAQAPTPSYYMGRGVCRHHLKKYKGAREDYLAMVNLLDKSPDLVKEYPKKSIEARQIAFYNASLASRGMKEAKEAVEYAEKSVALKPQRYAYYYYLAALYLEQKEWKKAIQTYERAAKALGQNMKAGSEKHLRQSVLLIYQKWGESLLNQGDDQRAVEVLEKSRPWFGTNYSRILILLGKGYSHLGDQNRALQYLRVARGRLNSIYRYLFQQVWYSVQYSQMFSPQWRKQTREKWANYLKTLETQYRDQRYEIFFHSGLCYHLQGNLSRALRFYDTAQKIRPEVEMVYYPKLLIYHQTGRSQKVEANLVQVMLSQYKKAKGSGEAQDRVLLYTGFHHHLQGKSTTALEIYNQVIDRRPQWTMQYFLRAIARFQLGERQGARKDIEVAQQRDPHHRIYKQLIQLMPSSLTQPLKELYSKKAK